MMIAWVRCLILPSSHNMLRSQGPTITLLINSRRISNRGMKIGVSKSNQMLKGHNQGISQIQTDIQEIVNFKKVDLIIKIRGTRVHPNSVMTSTMLTRTPTQWTEVSSLRDPGKIFHHTNLVRSHHIITVQIMQVRINSTILFNHNLAGRTQIILTHFRVNQLADTHRTTSSSTISRSISLQILDRVPTISTETASKEFSSRENLIHQWNKLESPLASSKTTIRRYNRLLMKLPRECIDTKRSMNASCRSWEISTMLSRPDRRWKSAHSVLRFQSKIEMGLRDQGRVLNNSKTLQETRSNSRRRNKTGSMNNLPSKIDSCSNREVKDWWVPTVEGSCRRNNKGYLKREWVSNLNSHNAGPIEMN